MSKKFYDIMDDMLNNETTVEDWAGSRYEKLRNLSPTEVNKTGEKFLHAALLKLGYSAQLNNDIHVKWSVMVGNIKFEVKVATLDSQQKHQFNSIRPNTDFTHLFLLGVCPQELYFKIIQKEDLGNYKLTPMDHITFKLPLETFELKSFDELEMETKNLLGA